MTVFNPFDEPIHSVHGPYKRKLDGRAFVCFVLGDESGRHTSMLLSRWLMTQHLRRPLLLSEHVDHVNDDPLDDRLENLQLLSQAENNRKSLLGRPSPLKGTEKGWSHGTMYAWQKKRCECGVCEGAKAAYREQRNASRRSGAKGPYRSRKSG